MGALTTLACTEEPSSPAEDATPTDTPHELRREDVAVSVVAGSSPVDDATVATRGGYRDGAALESEFAGPLGLAVDDAGNLYIADSNNRRIRVLSPNGIVITLAGDGEDDSDDGPASSASFRTPVDVALGPDGSVYVVDAEASNVRRIDPAGFVTTVAGVDIRGCELPADEAKDSDHERIVPDDCPTRERYRDGPADKAWFHQPSALVVADDGTIYVVDAANWRIRVVSPDGIVSTLAGSGSLGTRDGVGAEADFFAPTDMILGSDAALYITDGVLLRRVTLDGTVDTIAGDPSNLFGGHVDGPALDSEFVGLAGIAGDADRMCIADRGRFVRTLWNGLVRTAAGTGEAGFREGHGAQAEFSTPAGIAIGRDGELYLSDYNLSRIFRLEWQGGQLCGS